MQMATLSRDEVLKLAKLSQLSLTDEEVSLYQQELKAVLSYVEILQEADLGGVKPTNQVTGLVNVMRPDVVQKYQAQPEHLLDNAPQREGRYIKVRRVL